MQQITKILYGENCLPKPTYKTGCQSFVEKQLSTETGIASDVVNVHEVNHLISSVTEAKVNVR